MDFKVITLDQQAFANACLKLREKVVGSGFTPEVVIAIPRGGVYMQAAAWTDFSAQPVKLSGTSSSKVLKTVTSFILKRLPDCLRNEIRIWDAKRLIKRERQLDPAKIELPHLIGPKFSALVIDDAVDSGSTLLAVTESLQRAYPEAAIKTAALTVTSSNPLIMPDFYLYNDSTLLRMPWSADAR